MTVILVDMKLDKILDYAPEHLAHLEYICGIDEVSISSANAICLDCGSTKQQNSNLNVGLCVNSHDNWLEIDDDINLFLFACEKFNTDLLRIKNAITTNTDLLKSYLEKLRDFGILFLLSERVRIH